MEPNTVTIEGLEYRFAGESVLHSGITRFTIREYVVWNDDGPTDRFQVFRVGLDQPWTAWKSDTLSARKHQLRGALATHLTRYGVASTLPHNGNTHSRPRPRRQRPPITSS